MHNSTDANQDTLAGRVFDEGHLLRIKEAQRLLHLEVTRETVEECLLVLMLLYPVVGEAADDAQGAVDGLVVHEHQRAVDGAARRVYRVCASMMLAVVVAIVVGTAWPAIAASKYRCPQEESLGVPGQVDPSCVEDVAFTRDYHDPLKRSIANGLTVEFKDGEVWQEVVVEYPIGHARRQ
jgi:hypothetical protein